VHDLGRFADERRSREHRRQRMKIVGVRELRRKAAPLAETRRSRGESVGDRVEVFARVDAERAKVAARSDGERQLPHVDRPRDAHFERFARPLEPPEIGEQAPRQEESRGHGRVRGHDGRRPTKTRVLFVGERERERAIDGRFGGGTSG
jgi:hypothetical protein